MDVVNLSVKMAVETDHPGTLIPGLIEEMYEATKRSLTIEELATGLKISNDIMCDIIAGRRGIDMEIALKLEKAFNMSAEFWIQAQIDYDYKQAIEKINLDEIPVYYEGPPYPY